MELKKYDNVTSSSFLLDGYVRLFPRREEAFSSQSNDDKTTSTHHLPSSAQGLAAHGLHHHLLSFPIWTPRNSTICKEGHMERERANSNVSRREVRCCWRTKFISFAIWSHSARYEEEDRHFVSSAREGKLKRQSTRGALLLKNKKIMICMSEGGRRRNRKRIPNQHCTYGWSFKGFISLRVSIHTVSNWQTRTLTNSCHRAPDRAHHVIVAASEFKRKDASFRRRRIQAKKFCFPSSIIP